MYEFSFNPFNPDLSFIVYNVQGNMFTLFIERFNTIRSNEQINQVCRHDCFYFSKS